MIGHRIPLVDGKIDRWPELPGDYVGPVKGYSGDVEAMFFLLPIARDVGVEPSARSVHHITFPPHRYTEFPDGSVQVRESIASKGAAGVTIWHGYLDEHHEWRTLPS